MGSDVQAEINLYDSDILSIESVLKKLATRQGQSVDLESFRNEIVNRFREAGFDVKVSMWTTEQKGTFVPEVTIVDRVDKDHAFDYDRMVHEVTNDLLDLGEGGVISTKDLPGSS